ncbi:MAG: hypothetical protein ABSH51_30285 [Solirubrobacteraceae bacterium]
MHPAPAHLESKLRFWDFTVGQLAAAFAGIMLGVVWAKFISPLHGMWAAMSGAYIAALPVIPVFVASQTDFDLADLAAGAVRWRRRDGRYTPGAGDSATGYVLSVAGADADLGDDPGAAFDLHALWEEPSPGRHQDATTDSGLLVRPTVRRPADHNAHHAHQRRWVTKRKGRR